jgi:dihydroorotate dehydrogenase (NAD+) catalytic subunit
MNKDNPIAVTIGGVTFKNPVFTASGIWGYGEEIAPIVNVERLGAIVTKTITPEPRPGNPPPRIHELPTGMLNSIGLENLGIEAFVSEKLPRLRDSNFTIIVSIAADREDQFVDMAGRLGPLEGYAGIELNLSCPNVEKGALDHGRDPRFVEKVVGIVKKAMPDRPVFVKLTPNLDSIGTVAAAAEQGGADAISTINTLLGADFDLETGKPVFARVRAGYSGPGILPIALEKVWEVAQAVDIPIVGIGGISSIEDARKFFLAGATAIQVGTALYSDPLLPISIIDALEKNPGWIQKK